IATFPLLHESIAALASERASLPKRNPDVNRMRLLRPGTSVRFWAMLRKASSMLRAPYAPAPPPRRGTPMLALSGPGAKADVLIPPTTCLRRSMSLVKFCAICSAPVKFTTAMRRSGPPHGRGELYRRAADRAEFYQRHRPPQAGGGRYQDVGLGARTGKGQHRCAAPGWRRRRIWGPPHAAGLTEHGPEPDRRSGTQEPHPVHVGIPLGQRSAFRSQRGDRFVQ